MARLQSAAPNPSAKSWLDSWHVNPSINREYDFIDGLRGIAILMVLCCHHIYVNPQAGPSVQFFAALCNSAGGGVVLFFALSGFLISWPFWKRKMAQSGQIAPPRYAGRRFWKIYPPLALSLVLLTPLYIFSHNADWSYIPLAAKWLAGIPFILPVSGKLNPVMWTLVIEVQFYAVLPLVYLLLTKINFRMCLWLIPLLFLAAPVAFRALTGTAPTFTPEINAHFPSGLDAFFLGILLAGLDTCGVLKKNWAKLAWAGWVLWPVTLWLMAWVQVHPDLHGSWMDQSTPWLEKIASGCLLCYVANPAHPVARLLCAPWLRWCGIVSYDWYLFHQPIVYWFREHLGPAGGNPLRYMAIVGGSLLAGGIVSAVIYRFYSLPILQYGRERKKAVLT